MLLGQKQRLAPILRSPHGLKRLRCPPTVSFPVMLEVPIVVVLKIAVDDVVAPIAAPLILPPMICAAVTVVVPEK